MMKWWKKLQAAMAIAPMHDTYAPGRIPESEQRRREMIADRESEQREKCVEILMRAYPNMPRAKAEITYEITPPTQRPNIIAEYGWMLDEPRGMPTSHVPVRPPVVPAPRSSSRPDLTLVPSEGLVAAARGFEAGLGKYERDDWKRTVSAQRCLSSLIGHCARLADGETIDPESGRPAYEHIAARAAMLAHLMMRDERTNTNKGAN